MLVIARGCFCLPEKNRKLSECVRDDFDSKTYAVRCYKMSKINCVLILSIVCFSLLMW